MKCLILAGGFGTRLYPLVTDKSKALLEYKGKPLLSHLVAMVPGEIEIMVSTNLKFEADFRRWRQGIDREIDLCVEPISKDEQKKGAVGSLDYWVTTRNINQDLLVMAGDNYFGFVCAPSHATYGNIERTRSFTVSYPRPADIVATSLTASPRCDDTKPIVGLLETFPAKKVKGVFIKNAYLCLECELVRIVDGFGVNGLIAGKVVAAHVDPAALRGDDKDDADLLVNAPQMAYLYPGRFAVIGSTQAFPFPAGMKR